MSCPSIITIPSTECIGNSLTTINNNFSALEVAACDNYSYITNLNNDIFNLDNLIVNLTKAVIPGAAKAWVSFDGTRNKDGVVDSIGGQSLIYSSYNVSYIQKKQTGDYQIYFNTRFPSRNYVVIGTSRRPTWVQPYEYNTRYVEINVLSSTGVRTDTQNISIVVF